MNPCVLHGSLGSPSYSQVEQRNLHLTHRELKKIYPFLNMLSCISAGTPKSFVISRYDQHLMCLDAELHICS